MMEYTIKIEPGKGRVLFQGVTFGHGVGCELPLWDYLKRAGIVVVKKPGRTNWSSMLHPSVYCPAEFMVLQLSETSRGRRNREGWVLAEEIVSFEIRKPKECS